MPMTRRSFLSSAVAAASSTGFSWAAGGREASAPARPNIILFMVDQLSAKWLWEVKAMALPNFARLQARGVAFTNACVSNPVCVPSRASLATGLRTRGHGVLQNGYRLDPAMPTYARELQSAGWSTAAFGKLHHRPQFSGVHLDYRPYGYDRVVYTEDARAGFWLDWVGREHPEYYDSALVTVNDGVIPELHAYGPGRINLSARIDELRRKHSWGSAEYPYGTPGQYTLPFPAQISQSEWITRNAVEHILAAKSEQPIYAHISYVQPHSPFQPPAECMKNVDASLIPAPAGIEWTDDPLRPRCFPHTEGAHLTMPAHWRATRHYYLADLTHLDAQLGRVMDALERSGRLDNTYVLFFPIMASFCSTMASPAKASATTTPVSVCL